MRKKLLSLFLSLCFIIASAPALSVSAAEVEDNSGVSKKIALLSALGIVNDMNLVEFEADRTVVKKAFYSAVYNIMSDEVQTDTKLISLLNNYQIRVSEAELRDNIKRSEALSAAVCLLGYTYTAPSAADILDVANQLGITRYVSGNLDEYITVGEMVNLIYGVVEEDMLTVSVNSTNGRFGFTRLQDITPLNYYRDIYLVKGYVNKNSYASVVDDTPALKGYVYIDSEALAVGKTNAADYLGMPVVSYVKYNDDKEGTLLYIVPNNKYVTVIDVPANEIISVDDEVTKIEYEYGDKAKTAKLSNVVKVIFNGKNYGEYTKKDLMPEVGSIELIDSNNDRIIDVVNVKSYQTILVNYVSDYSKTVISKYNDPSVLNLDPHLNEIIIEKNGAVAALTDIKPNDILLVAASKGTTDGIIRVLASDRQAFLKITSADYTEKELYADSEIYKLSAAFIRAISDKDIVIAKEFVPGSEYILYLDAFGNVAFAVSQAGKIYLYTMRIWADADADSYGMKALNMEGTWKAYEWDEKIKVDDIEDKTISKSQRREKAYDLLGKGAFVPQLLRVEMTVDGKIKSIETAEAKAGYDENKFTKYSMDRERIFTTEVMSFGGDVYVTNDTKVILAPKTPTLNEEDYQVANNSWFKMDKWYMVDAYDIDKFYRASVVFYRPKEEKNLSGELYYITKVSTVVVDESERTKIECLYKGSPVEFVTAYGNKEGGLKAGNVIQIETNLMGEVKYHGVYAEVTSQIVPVYPPKNDPAKMHAGMAKAAGIVKEVGIAENMLLVNCGGTGAAGEHTTEPNARFKFIGMTTCYLFDGDAKEKIKAISSSDIKPGDNVYIFISYTRVSSVYVMRNVK